MDKRQKLNFENLLFDLDGTIIDPINGIMDSYAYALEKLGKKPFTIEDMEWVIGPPLRKIFAKIGIAENGLEDAVSLYREYYSKHGIFNIEVYDGIKETLLELKSHGKKLYICTSKAQVFAKRIIEHIGFEDIFIEIYGALLNGQFDDKAELIAHILQEQKLEKSQTIMIGDKDNDMRAANANGLEKIGCLWGYGSIEELESYGCQNLAKKTIELISFLK